MSKPTFPNRPVYPARDLVYMCAGTHDHGDSQVKKSDMSLRAMTAWICGTLLFMGAIALYFATRMDPLERDAECQTAFGMDEECLLENASERLRGGAYLAQDPLAPPTE